MRDLHSKDISRIILSVPICLFVSDSCDQGSFCPSSRIMLSQEGTVGFMAHRNLIVVVTLCCLLELSVRGMFFDTG